jgi:hypothetical protein
MQKCPKCGRSPVLQTDGLNLPGSSFIHYTGYCPTGDVVYWHVEEPKSIGAIGKQGVCPAGCFRRQK